MKLFLLKNEPEGDFLLKLKVDENLNAWLKRLRALGVPQSSLNLERIKDLHGFSEKPEGEHLIAEGVLPTNEGVEVLYHFEFMNQPAHDDNEPADYYTLGFGIDVMENQLLAEQVVQGPGQDGFDILGMRLPHTVFGSQSQLHHNANVIIEKEGHRTKFFSKINGVLYNDDKENLKVEESFKVQGSVGFKTGNISCGSPVEILGDVKAGFSIRSGSHVHVKGVVEKNATIEAEGNVVIEGGVSPNTKIKAKGDIHVKFAQGTSLESGANIHVASYFYDSFAFAEQAFYCSGVGAANRGAVIGGRVNAVKKIDLISVGSNNALTTLICGFDYNKSLEYQELVELKDSLESDVKRHVRMLPIDLLDPNFKAQMKALPEREKQICGQRIQQIITNREECEILGTRISELGPKINTYFKQARISIKKSLCPDVKIMLNNDYKLVCREMKAVEFGVNDGQISSNLEPETSPKK